MTTTTSLEEVLTQVLHLIAAARTATPETDPLRGDLHEVELTLHEVCDLPDITDAGQTHTAHTALVAAEATLDTVARGQRPLWLLPLRTELAILRRRSAA